MKKAKLIIRLSSGQTMDFTLHMLGETFNPKSIKDVDSAMIVGHSQWYSKSLRSRVIDGHFSCEIL